MKKIISVILAAMMALCVLPVTAYADNDAGALYKFDEHITVNAVANDDNDAARAIEPLEETIDDMVMVLKDRHTKRLKSGACSVGSGLVFMDALTHLERASDHCSSVAVMMLARSNEEILQNHYDYLRVVHQGNDEAYSSERNRRREQYLKPLKEIQI